MKSIDRKHVVEEFAAYTANYNPENPKIKLKIDHTYRVASMAETIAKSIVSQYPWLDIDMTWLCGMLHDIGRFEQVRRYDTFTDSLSVDHAQFGADLLFQEGLLEKFGKFTDEERKVLEISIRNHSVYRIDENLSEEMKVYCRVLRDADKVDIFRINCDTPLEDIYNVTTEELKTASVSPEVKQCFLERHAVLRHLKKTAVDHSAAHVCLLFELEYPKSRKLAKEQGYLDKMLELESDNPDTAEWFRYMRENIWK